MPPNPIRGHPISRASSDEKLYYTHFDSPVGQLLLAGTEEKLRFLSFSTGHKAFGPLPNWAEESAPFQHITEQLEAYFDGELIDFQIPLELSGTPFQNRVWRYLATIPYGQTRTYGKMATDLGQPNASRAVGAANGNNPIPVILPCHRVIGANGALTGFGGGLPVKRFLLELESNRALA